MTPDQRRRRQGRPDNQGTPFIITPTDPSVAIGVGSQQFLQVRTLFAKDVSTRGGFPSWDSDTPGVATISQPNDADGDGVVEDAGGLAAFVGTGTSEIDALFPGADAPSQTLTVT